MGNRYVRATRSEMGRADGSERGGSFRGGAVRCGAKRHREIRAGGTPRRMAASGRSEPDLDALGRVAQDTERSTVDLDDVARLSVNDASGTIPVPVISSAPSGKSNARPR